MSGTQTAHRRGRNDKTDPPSSYPTAEEPNPWVSTRSRWLDIAWRFDNETEGNSSQSVAVWSLPLPHGGNLVDEAHSVLLHEIRCLALSSFIDARAKAAYKTSLASPMSASLRKLAAWMINHHYDSVSQLDSTVFAEYLEDVAVEIQAAVEAEVPEDMDAASELSETDGEASSGLAEEEADEIGVGYSTVYLRLWPWSLLWNQRSALEELGITVSTQPFHSKPIGQICRELATVVYKRIPPVPDAIAIEVLNGAHRFVERVADDLITFSIHAAPIYAQAKEPTTAIYRWLLRAVQTKSLPTLGLDEDDLPRTVSGFPRITLLNQLFSDFTAAVAIILQAETGMRINEVVSVQCGWNSEGTLPACIEVKPSTSGAMDLYYLKATLSKTVKRPVESTWLLGARLAGSTHTPPAVQVIVLLLKLFDPWRSDQDTAKDRRLFVLFGNGGAGFPSGGGSVLTRFAHASTLRIKCRGFTERYVELQHLPDLPEYREYKEAKGGNIKTHQWRKTYARFVYHVDGRLLPAIARQFKHVSLAMTEGAYVGTVSDAVAEHNRSKAVDLLLDFARGQATTYEGRLAKTLERYKGELSLLIDGLREHEAYATLDQWACARDLRMFFHGYGGCIPALAPTESACHKRAGTTHWANTEPNYKHRQTSVCTGCFLFIAGQESVDYWTERFVENMTAWREAKLVGREREFRVQLERAGQSEKYLRTLGAPIPTIAASSAGGSDGC